MGAQLPGTKKILTICSDYCEDYETMVPFGLSGGIAQDAGISIRSPLAHAA